MELTDTDRKRLEGVSPRLVQVVHEAAKRTPVPFIVAEGLRTLERERKLVLQGRSQTLHSRHLTGRAVDLWALQDGQVVWCWPCYQKIATAMKAAADDLSIRIQWGGDWITFHDGAHFQLVDGDPFS